MSDVMERIANALERLADSHSETVKNQRMLVEQSRSNEAVHEVRATMKKEYDLVYQQNIMLRQELENVRMAALSMRSHFERKQRECHDGSIHACNKKHEGDER